MTSMLGSLFYMVVMAWLFLLITIMLYQFTLYLHYRRMVASFLFLIFAVVNYLVFLVLLDFYEKGPFRDFDMDMLRIQAISYLLLASALVYPLMQNLRIWTYRHITINSIKEAAEKSPSAICCCYKNGKLALVNEQMLSLSLEITGRVLHNGNRFFSRISNGDFVNGYRLISSGDAFIVSAPDGRVFSFTRREVKPGKYGLYEIIGSDVSEVYKLTQELNTNIEKQKKANERIRKYSKDLLEVTRQREIMNTKSRIHDDMNLMLLRTRHLCENGTPQELKEMLFKWSTNSILLLNEAENQSVTTYHQLRDNAEILGLELVTSGSFIFDNQEIHKLLLRAGTEAMANAVKHAQAKTLYITHKEYDDYFTVEYTDDGECKKAFDGENGGLKNLRDMAENFGAEMAVDYSDRFKIMLIFK